MSANNGEIKKPKLFLRIPMEILTIIKRKTDMKLKILEVKFIKMFLGIT